MRGKERKLRITEVFLYCIPIWSTGNADVEQFKPLLFEVCSRGALRRLPLCTPL